MIKAIESILKEYKDSNLSSNIARKEIAKEIENKISKDFLIIEKKENLSLGSNEN
jgi:hypothetical protein